MSSVPDTVHPWQPLLDTAKCWCRCFIESGSTMEVARAIVQERSNGSAADSPRFGLVLSQKMSGGRGRHGRVWRSPEQGFYATYTFGMQRSLRDLSGLSLVVGVCVAEALEELLGKAAVLQLKWPNDILDQQGRKLGGILIEISASGSDTQLFIGIGLNLAGIDPELRSFASSLAESYGVALTALAVAQQLSPRLDKALHQFEGAGFPDFQQRWERHGFGIGGQVSFQMTDSTSPITGVLRGVDAEGRLLIQSPNGEIQPFSVGEIHSVRAAPSS